MMTYIGLFFELVFLGFGIYLYLFSRGQVKGKDPKTQARFDEFRQQNGGWMRIAGLALVAIMLINIVIHVIELAR